MRKPFGLESAQEQKSTEMAQMRAKTPLVRNQSDSALRKLFIVLFSDLAL